ncbi:hypothetical protein P4K11_32685, partial [Bacillus cereus]
LWLYLDYNPLELIGAREFLTIFQSQMKNSNLKYPHEKLPHGKSLFCWREISNILYVLVSFVV